MASWTVFELLAMIFHTMLWSLRVMAGIWMGICVVVAMAGYLRGGQQIFQTRWGEHKPWNTVQKILLVLVGAFVVLQTVNTVFGTYYGNWDDGGDILVYGYRVQMFHNRRHTACAVS